MSESVVIFSKSVLQGLIFLANMNSLDDFHDDSSILKRQLQFLIKFFGFSKFGVSVAELCTILYQFLWKYHILSKCHSYSILF